jgi:hypothetical protein
LEIQFITSIQNNIHRKFRAGARAAKSADR